jgi:hypothetical protein
MIRLFEVLLHGGTRIAGWSTNQIHEAVLATFDLSAARDFAATNIFTSARYKWGGLLFDFMGWTDANDAGRGFLRDEWAVYADSGPLGWSVIG